MSSSDSWFSEKFCNLLQEDLRISTLNELKDHLSSLPHEETTRIANILQLPLVFDCLNDTNSEQVDLACEVLSLCLSNLNLGESTNRYGTALERALIHPYAAVKHMALNEIKRSLSNEEVLYGLCQKNVLISNIVACLGDSDLGVATKASDIIITLGKTVPGANKIASHEFLIALQQVMSISEVIRLRIYEMIVTISKHSDHSFKQLESVGLLTRIVDELGNNDVLLKMNIIEILSQFAQSEHGYVFLDESNILKKILILIDEDELTTQLYQPGILKFFGHIGHRKPREMLVKYPRLFDILFSNIENEDLIIVGISLDTIGYIGQTSEGKIALDSTDNQLEVAIKTISRLLNSFPTEIKVKALTCIENLLRVTGGRNDLMAITESWYGLLGTDPIDVILKYAKNPFSELRLAGLGILNAIAGQIWGQEAVKNTPERFSVKDDKLLPPMYLGRTDDVLIQSKCLLISYGCYLSFYVKSVAHTNRNQLVAHLKEHVRLEEFLRSPSCTAKRNGLIEFLLDRSVETVKGCKEAKYEIVKLLSYSTLFDHNVLENFQTFVKEGPFYVQAVPDVAIEGN